MTTNNRTVGEKEIITGTVVARYLPGWKTAKSGNDYLASGKLVLESEEDGVCEVSFLQVYVDNVRTEEMGPLWTGLDLDTIQGKKVSIACTFESDYTNSTTGAVKHQFRNPTLIKFLNPGDEPPMIPTQTTQVAQTTPVTPSVVPTTAPIVPPIALQSVMPMTFEEKKRHDIAWNGAVNLAVPLARKPVEPTADDLEHRQTSISNWIERVDELAWPLYLLKLRGPVEPVQITPEEELFQEATDLSDGVVGLNRTGEI